MLEKKKMLVTIFSFSNNVLHLSQHKFQFFNLHLFLSSAFAFNLVHSKILSFVKEFNMFYLNSIVTLYNCKTLDLSKLKRFADNTLTLVQILIFVYNRIA